MAEKPVTIPVEGLFLEGMHEPGSCPEAVLLCHPHPLYGGDMDNSVIHALRSAVQGLGWGTLRFNFRGVGRSGGEYGEGEGEVKDVLAAADYLFKEGVKRLHIAGYSFGAWIALKAIYRGLDPASAVLISPPLDFLNFDGLTLPSFPCLVTLGDRDSYCSLQSLQEWISNKAKEQNPHEVQIVPGCDHFYWGAEGDLSVMASAFLKKHFQEPVRE